MENIPRPNIFQYDNFRQFLTDFFAFSKSLNPQFSYRKFAKLAGSNNAGLLKLIIDGKRNLSEKHCLKIATAFNLKGEEASYFKSLVMLNQAQTPEERLRFAKDVLRSRGLRKFRPLAENQYQYMSHWYFIVIRELVALPSFKEDAKWISEKLDHKVPLPEIARAIEILLNLQLIKRDENGRLVQSPEVLLSSDEVFSPLAAQFHADMIKLGAEAIFNWPRELRDISNITCALSQEGVKSIKEILQKFRKELVEVVSREKNADGVYEINFQFFPLTKRE